MLKKAIEAKWLKFGTKLVEKELTMPTPQSWPIFGTLPALMANGGAEKLHLYVDRRHTELGPIYREKIGPTTAVFISDPDDMRRVFSLEGKYPKHHLPESWLLYNQQQNRKRGVLFMDDDEWLHYRRILNGLMLKQNDLQLVENVGVAASHLVDKWENRKRVEDLEGDLYTWSLEVILAVLLGKSSYTNNKQLLDRFITTLSPAVHSIFIESAALSLLPVKLATSLKLAVWRRFVRSADTAIDVGNQMVEELIKLEPDEKGLLRKLIDSQVDVENTKRIVTDLILAAGDTTAYTTQWMLYLLSKNQDKQQEVYEQVMRKDEDDSWLRAVLRETLRLYPVAPFLTRMLPNDELFRGYKIHAGELILLSLYTSGRNKAYFQDPHKFKPERWLRTNGNKEVANSYASIPFAMGARSCVGRKIAEQQICITIREILKKYRLEVENESVDMFLKLISVPSEKIKLKLYPRDK